MLDKMLKVKICGITNYDDAAMAVRLGADALGFIFASSPRKISSEGARDIIRKLPPFIKSVGVFVNEIPDKISEIIGYCGIDNIQLHGDEAPELCEKYMPRTIKALRVKDESILDLLATQAPFLPPWLRIVATSRPNQDILNRIENMYVFMASAEMPDNCQDLRIYVCKRLESMALQLPAGENKSTVIENIE